MSLGSKYDEMNDFYTLFNAFINTHETTTTETKNRIMNNMNQPYNKHFYNYKKNYNSGKVKYEEKRGSGSKQFGIIDNGDQETKSAKKKETETKKPDEIQKPL